MPFVKSQNHDVDHRTFEDFLEAKNMFEDTHVEQEVRLRALEYMLSHHEVSYVLKSFKTLFAHDDLASHIYIDYAFSNFPVKLRREEDFECLASMLKMDNAYLRNMVIRYLQSFGEEIKQFLQNMLDDNDSDTRIFAINVIGDVRFEDALSLLRYVLAKDENINVVATAIDYLGEIGSSEDKAILQAVQQKFKDEPYIEFAVKSALKRLDA